MTSTVADSTSDAGLRKVQATLKTRCSVKQINEIMNYLMNNKEKMDAVEEMGFGSLKYLPETHMDLKFAKKLLDAFNVGSCSVYGEKIKADDVEKILGISSHGRLVPTDISDTNKETFKNKFDKKSCAQLRQDIERLESADIESLQTFKETFLLYVLSQFLCPTTKDSPSTELYSALSIVSDAKDYNWGKSPEDVDAGRPVMTAWTKEKMKKALKKPEIESPSVTIDSCSKCIILETRVQMLEQRVQMLEQGRSPRIIDKQPSEFVSQRSEPIANFEITDDSCLNSDILDTYISYLRRTMTLGDRFILSTYIYEKLKRLKNSTYTQLRRWWDGQNLFQYSYIFVPIFEDDHWSLVVICCTEGRGPILLHMDSSSYHSSEVIFNRIKGLLTEEWNFMKEGSCSELPFADNIMKDLPANISTLIVQVPQQEDIFDCGVFVLYFMKLLLEKTSEKINWEDVARFKHWCKKEDARAFRWEIKDVINEQQLKESPLIPKKSTKLMGASIGNEMAVENSPPLGTDLTGAAVDDERVDENAPPSDTDMTGASVADEVVVAVENLPPPLQRYRRRGTKLMGASIGNEMAIENSPPLGTDLTGAAVEDERVDKNPPPSGTDMAGASVADEVVVAVENLPPPLQKYRKRGAPPSQPPPRRSTREIKVREPYTPPPSR